MQILLFLMTVYDNVTNYDSITVETFITYATYDTITYLNTSYFAEYKDLTLGLNGSLEKSTSSNPVPDVCIYPNPTTTSINIECDTKFDGYTLRMVEVATGRQVFVEVISQTQTILSIEDLGLVPGMYQLVFEYGEDIVSKKLIIN